MITHPYSWDIADYAPSLTCAGRQCFISWNNRITEELLQNCRRLLKNFDLSQMLSPISKTYTSKICGPGQETNRNAEGIQGNVVREGRECSFRISLYWGMCLDVNLLARGIWQCKPNSLVNSKGRGNVSVLYWMMFETNGPSARGVDIPFTTNLSLLMTYFVMGFDV